MRHLAYIAFPAVLNANRRIAIALRRRGTRVTVLSPMEVPTAGGILSAEAATDGVELMCFKRAGRHRLLRLAGLTPWLMRAKPDAVLVEAEPGTVILEQALLAGQWLGIPVACTSCEVEERDFFREGLHSLGRIQVRTGLGKLAGRLLEKLQLGRLDTLFCYGPIPKQIFRGLKGYRGRIVEVPLGVDTEQFPFSPNPRRDGRLTVAYVGRMHRGKSIETMIDACAMLNPKPRLMIDELYWEADPQYRNEIRARVRDCGFGDEDVDFFNPHHSEVAQHLRRADVVVLTPSKVIEQYGRAIAEAMSMGKAVIVSKSGHLPFLVGDAGIVVDGGDHRAVADAIRRLRDDNEYSELSMRARRRVEECLSVDVQARHIESWLTASCNGRISVSASAFSEK